MSGGGDARVQKSKTAEDVEQRADDTDGVHAATAAAAAEPVRRSQRAAAADAAKNISNFLSGDLSGLRGASPAHHPYPPPTPAAEAKHATFVADPLLVQSSSHRQGLIGSLSFHHYHQRHRCHNSHTPSDRPLSACNCAPDLFPADLPPPPAAL